MNDLEKDFKIADIIDIEKISKILDSFSKITGIVTAILDLEGNILVKTGWREICTNFHRVHPQTAVNCKKSDTVLSAQLSTGVKYNAYKCLNGLVDIAVPIIIRGKHIGNLFTGQFLFDSPDIKTFWSQAESYGFDPEQYLRALADVPVIKEKEVKDIIGFLLNLTEMLGEMGLTNIKQVETNNALEESKIFNEALLNTTPDIIYVYDLRSKSNVYSNDGIQKILGYSVTEIKEMGNALIKKLMHSDDYKNYINTIIPNYLKAWDEEIIEHEYRMRHKTGHWLWLHSKETIFSRDNNGVPVQIFGVISDITADKKAKEEISKIKRILEETGELANVGGWEFDVETRDVTWTKEVALIHDLNPDDSTSLETGLKYYTPDSRMKIEDAIIQSLTNNSAFDLELELISAKGVYKWVRAIGKPITNNGIVTKLTGSFQDITKIKSAEKQLKENSNFLDAIIDDAAISMWISDKDGNAIRVNNACLTLFGAKREEVIGRYNIFKDNVVEKMGFMPLVESVFKEGRLVDFIIDYNLMEVEHVDVKDATHKVIRTVITPVLGLKKEVTHAIVQTIDLSEIKKTEKELIRAKENAEESDKLKTAFLANMSHEIRTPMNGILGFAELLKNPDLTGEEQNEYIDVIEKSGTRMLNIISDLIDISKIETGQVEVVKEGIELNQLMKDLLFFFTPQAVKRGLSLNCKTESNKSECYIISDRTKLNQVLTNLIGNAMKFTRYGQIDFGYSYNGSQVLFYVRDTGIGIPSDLQEKIFERFIQGDLTPANASEGSGLGLAISKAYVEKLGGRIWVESEPGKGSVFYFNLPYQESGKDLCKHNEEPHAIPGITKEMKILIAEDDEISFFYLQELLKANNIKIVHAFNGREAVEFCENHKDINLVLMDIKMPVMNGLEATTHIKKINPSLPVIAQSAYITTRDKDVAREAGCDEYIEKPVRKEILYNLIRHYV